MSPQNLLLSFLVFTFCFKTYSVKVSNTSINHTIQTNVSLLPTNQPFVIWNHVLALTYGPNYCIINQCFGNKIDFEFFTIHGLWPNSQPPNWPSTKPFNPTNTVDYCDLRSTLQLQDVAPFERHLNFAWPSITHYQVPGQPLGFWNYEWRKHGTCTAFNKPTYFRRALALYHIINVDYVLRLLRPSDGYVYYSAQDIHDIHLLLQFPRPYVICNILPSGFELLAQLYYCVDDIGNTPLDCRLFYSNQDLTNCRGRFKILQA